MILVDSNILLDVFDEGSAWMDWSLEQLRICADIDHLAINPIIYAEISSRFSSLSELDAELPETLYWRLSLPYEAAHLAGCAFKSYRSKGGSKSAPLPDFYIGAHALYSGMKLLTRDTARYKTYFPKLELITPD